MSGNTVTGVAPGTYTLAAAAETPEGTVYTDVSVEVVVAADSLIVEGLPERLFEGETAKLTVALSPDNVTHPGKSRGNRAAMRSLRWTIRAL